MEAVVGSVQSAPRVVFCSNGASRPLMPQSLAVAPGVMLSEQYGSFSAVSSFGSHRSAGLRSTPARLGALLRVHHHSSSGAHIGFHRPSDEKVAAHFPWQSKCSRGIGRESWAPQRSDFRFNAERVEHHAGRYSQIRFEFVGDSLRASGRTKTSRRTKTPFSQELRGLLGSQHNAAR
jgi:hypothetical protein